MAVRPSVMYKPCDTSSREQTGNIITFAQFEEGNILTKTFNDAESGDESDDESIMTMDSSDDSDHDLISTEVLEDIRDGSQTHLNVNRRGACYKKRDRINQRQSEWKGALKATQIMGKGLHKVFKTVVKKVSPELTPLGESGSEVSPFIPEPRNFAEVTKLSENINKPWLKATLIDINNLINNQTFLIEYPEKYEPVTPCMDVYKAKI